MAAALFMICKDCEETAWLEDYEIPSFIEEHNGHSMWCFSFRDEDFYETFERQFRKFMGWSVEK